MTDQNQYPPRTPELGVQRGQESGREQGLYSGQEQRQTYGNSSPGNAGVPGQGAAVASLVLGIIGLFFAGIILGIIGLVMASKSKREGYAGGMRTAGFVLSLIALILGAMLAVLLIVSSIYGTMLLGLY